MSCYSALPWFLPETPDTFAHLPRDMEGWSALTYKEPGVSIKPLGHLGG